MSIVGAHSKTAISPSRLRWRRFFASFTVRIALGLVAVFIGFGVLAPWLATDQPWYIQIEDQSYFPAFSSKEIYVLKLEGKEVSLPVKQIDWKRMPAKSVIWAPIVYAPGKTDRQNGYLNANYRGPGSKQLFQNSTGETVAMPTRFRHWLGTGRNGEDVFAGLIHGTRSSLTVAIAAMGIAALLGILLGALAGFWGDFRAQWSRARVMAAMVGLVLAWFYAFQRKSWHGETDGVWMADTSWFGSILLFLLILSFFLWLGSRLERLGSWWRLPIKIPVDGTIMRSMEVFHAVPHLVLIIALAALIRTPNPGSLVLILGLTSWTGIARLVRAEMLRLRELNFLQAGEALGLPAMQLLWKHALPNALAPALVAVAFGVGATVLLESGLSFLGIGLPSEMVSWGALIRSGQNNFAAWWMVVFPGIALLATVAAFNWLGEGIRDAFDPRFAPEAQVKEEEEILPVEV